MTELGSVITAVLLPVVKWLNTILAYLTAIVRAFKAVFGFGSSSAEKASKSLGNMSVSAGGLSENLGSATAKAKELKKTIAGFDELEILNGPEEDSGSGSGSVAPIGVSGGYDVGEYFDPEDWETPDLTKFQKQMENFFKNWKDGWDKLTDALTKNTETMEKALDWKKILGLGALAGILGGIGSQLVKHFKDWLKFTEEVPGLNMFDRLTTGVKYALFVVKKHFTDFIGELGTLLAPVGKLLNQWLIQPLLHPVKTLQTLGTAFKSVFTAIGNAIGNLIGTIGNLVGSFIQCCKEFGFFNTLGEVVKDLLASLKGMFQNLWGVIAANPLVAIAAAIALVIASLVSTYKRVKEFREALDELWKNVLRPVVDYVIEQAQYVWNAILKPLWENIKGMVGDLVELVTAIWNKVSEFIAWVTYYILPPIWMVAGEIIAVATRIFGNIGEIVNGIITVIRGIIQFITGVFTGDWSKAWEGVKLIFKGIWDSLVGYAKGPLNLIIGLINGALAAIEGALNAVARALNRINIKIPWWVPGFGGKTYGFNISTVSLVRIPYLADGAVLTEPTTATMAEYAGAHNNPEIVTPENLLRQIVMEGNDDLADTFIAVGRQIVAAIQDNSTEIRIGDDVISAAAARGDRDFRKRTGRSQFAI